mgnify:CR=1 FL=1
MEKNELSNKIKELKKELNDKTLEFDKRIEQRYDEIYQEGGDTYIDEQYKKLNEQRQEMIDGLTEKIDLFQAELEKIEKEEREAKELEEKERKEFEDSKNERLDTLEKQIDSRIAMLDENGESIYLDEELTKMQSEFEKVRKEVFISSREKEEMEKARAEAEKAEAEAEKARIEKEEKDREISDAKEEYEKLKIEKIRLEQKISEMIPDKGKFSSFSEMKSKLKENLAKLIENGKVEKDDEYKKCLSDMTKIEPEVLKEELKQLDEEIKKMKESNVREDSPEFQEALRDKLQITAEIERMNEELNKKKEELSKIQSRISELENEYGQLLKKTVKINRGPASQPAVQQPTQAEKPVVQQPTQAEKSVVQQPTQAEKPVIQQLVTARSVLGIKIDPKSFLYHVSAAGIYYEDGYIDENYIDNYLDNNKLEDVMATKGVSKEVIKRLIGKGDDYIIAAILQDDELTVSEKIERLNAYDEAIIGNKKSKDVQITYDLRNTSLFDRLIGKCKLTPEFVKGITDIAYDDRNFANVITGPLTKIKFKIKDMIENARRAKLQTSSEKMESQVSDNNATKSQANEQFKTALKFKIPQSVEANKNNFGKAFNKSAQAKSQTQKDR